MFVIIMIILAILGVLLLTSPWTIPAIVKIGWFFFGDILIKFWFVLAVLLGIFLIIKFKNKFDKRLVGVVSLIFLLAVVVLNPLVVSHLEVKYNSQFLVEEGENFRCVNYLHEQRINVRSTTNEIDELNFGVATSEETLFEDNSFCYMKYRRKSKEPVTDLATSSYDVEVCATEENCPKVYYSVQDWETIEVEGKIRYDSYYDQYVCSDYNVEIPFKCNMLNCEPVDVLVKDVMICATNEGSPETKFHEVFAESEEGVFSSFSPSSFFSKVWFQIKHYVGGLF